MAVMESGSSTGVIHRRLIPYGFVRRGRKSLARRKGKKAEGFSRFFLTIVVLTLAPILFDVKLAGFNLTGWSWVFALLFALWRLSRTSPKKISFPVRIWLPWCVLLVTYLVFTSSRLDAIQTTCQMLTPIAVGLAASTFHPSSEQLQAIAPSLDRLAWVVCGLVVAMALLKFGDALPDYGFMLMPVIFSLVLAAVFAAFYACGDKRYIWYYGAMAALPIICYVRGPILAAFASLPLTPAPLGKYRRLAICGVILLIGITLFYTPRFQARMFASGRGNLEELEQFNLNDPNLLTAGRSAMWDFLWAGFKKRPWFGHGLNQSRTALLDNGFPTFLPHNDWLKLLYEIGLLGTACFFLTMLLQVLQLRSIGKHATGLLAMLAYAMAGAFVPFALLMLTDNVILYVQFFGNLHFCLIGFIYGRLRSIRAQKTSVGYEQFACVQCSYPAL